MEVKESNQSTWHSRYPSSSLSSSYGKKGESRQEKVKSFANIPFAQKYVMGIVALSYYMGFVPFRFKLTWSLENELEYNVKRNIFQKLFCVIIHAILLFGSILILYSAFGTENGRIKASSILQALLSIFGAAMCWYFTFCVWCHQEKLFLPLLKTRQTNQSTIVQPKKFQELAQNIFSILCPLVSMTSTVCIAILDNAAIWGKEPWNLKHCFGLIFALIVVLGNFPNIIYVAASLCFRDRANEFLDLVRAHSTSKGMVSTVSPETVLREYYSLLNFVNKLNDKYGMFTLMSSVFTIPFYSQKFADLFKSSVSISMGLLSVAFFCGMIFFLMISAGVSHQVCGEMENWLVKRGNHVHISSTELTILMTKLTPDAIGLRGKNFFTITYPFLGSIISMIITYAFIDQNLSSSRPTVLERNVVYPGNGAD